MSGSPEATPSSNTSLKVDLSVGIPLGLLVLAGVLYLAWFCGYRSRTSGSTAPRPSVAGSVHATDKPLVPYDEHQLPKELPFDGKQSTRVAPIELAQTTTDVSYGPLPASELP